MSLVALYFAFGLIFFGIDMIGIPLLILPEFEAALGPLLIAEPRLDAALLFYLLYPAGMFGFVLAPAWRTGRGAAAAAAPAAGFGLVAYGTYELTNLATLAPWTWRLTAIDMAWGAALSGVSAALAVALVGAVFARR